MPTAIRVLVTLGAVSFWGPSIVAREQSLSVAPSYSTDGVVQYQSPTLPDVIPADPELRRLWARSLALDAAIYGTASVLQYQQFYAQVIDKASAEFTGPNVFKHGRELAGPDYSAFKTPNADTLYSNAWLDLTNGPVLLDLPDTHGRYYDLQFLDMYANSTNISMRTHGARGGRFLIAPALWHGEAPAGTEVFRVATPFTWVLLRILADEGADMREACALQERFTLTALVTGSAQERIEEQFPTPKADTAAEFFRILDFIVRVNGHPEREDALWHRYQAIGLGVQRPFDMLTLDPQIQAGIDEGYADARRVIASSIRQRTGKIVNGWGFARDVGRYGFNYILRATINTLGTGANVRDENGTFVTFSDAQGKALDGLSGRYRLVLHPPPSKYFWSITLYDAKTQRLHRNPINRYLISDRTKQLHHEPDGSVVVRIQAARPEGAYAANWLPAPAGSFYLVVRAQGPEAVVLNGDWFPGPVGLIGKPGT